MNVRWFVFALALFATAAPRASAQDTLTATVDRALTQTWFENEGLWRGVWVPSQPGSSAGGYAATWTLIGHSDRANASLIITIHGDHVDIARHNRNGVCGYQGTLTADHRSVSGTYSCDGGPALHWSAVIGAQGTPAGASTTPDVRLPQLRYTWVEREGDWRGTWVPHNGSVGDGLYEGRWVQPPRTGAVVAQLTITLHGYDVTVRRVQSEGSCVYTGRMALNQRQVSGTYTCDWHADPLPWSADVQMPR